jgi:cytochrome d ubiquinol oxidase subunit I
MENQDRPHLLGLIYYSFRIMIAIGFFLAAVMAVSVLQWLRGKCRRRILLNSAGF